MKPMPRFLPIAAAFRMFLLPAILFTTACISLAQPGPGPLRVAIVGLEHGHVEGFLGALPKHTDVELVGIADADPALFAKYKNKYSLAETLFYRSEANMIEKTKPQAVLVYTSIAEHRLRLRLLNHVGFAAVESSVSANM